MLFLGIDEAGKGPVIGPLSIVGCLITEDQSGNLREFKVKDSKDLTPKRREFMEKRIRNNSESIESQIIHPEEIDDRLSKGSNMNFLEAEKVAEIINKLNVYSEQIKVVVDCPSVGISKWKELLMTKIDKLSNLEIVCEHKADKNHVSVSAASIIAKNIREKEMNSLKEKFGHEMGSGYASDPATSDFVKRYAKKYGDKGLFRKSWKTWKNASSGLEQSKL